MIKLNLRRMVLVFILALSSSILSAQQTFNTTIYLDYTYFLSDNGPLTTPVPPGEMNNFFTFRRAYFTYENKVSDKLKFRFRYDADYVKSIDKSGKPDDKLRPFMKHLYLEWSNPIPNSSLKIGMADTLTFKLAEDRWGLRSVAKTLVDGYKDVTGKDIDATSADVGLNFSGTISKEFRYAFMVCNGASYSHPEQDKYKKIAGQVHFVPVSGFSLVGYVDYEKQDKVASALTYKVDSFMEMVRGLILGFEGFIYQNELNKINGKEYNRAGYSIFGRYSVISEKLFFFGRFDRYEPNNQQGEDEMNLFIAGIDWTPLHSSFKLQPNIWYYDYADSNKKSDLIFNLTFFLSF